MNVLRHDHIANYDEPILPAHGFEGAQEQVATPRASKQRQSAITTEREEVKLAGLVEAFQSPRHGDRVFPQLGSSL